MNQTDYMKEIQELKDLLQCREDYIRDLEHSLAAYEDTGLSPEEVREFVKAKEGLPCKIGDSLFFITSMYSYLDEPREEHVRKIEVFDNNSMLIRTETRTVKPERIGEVVFTTRESAEKALKEMEE